MDQTDKRILALLKHDARISFTSIGKKINLSRTAVQDRIKKLESNGVIKGYSAQFSIEAAGMISAIIFIKIASRPCNQALNWLTSLEEIHEVLSVSGKYDAVARCIVASPSELTKLNDKIGSSNLIESSISSLILAQKS